MTNDPYIEGQRDVAIALHNQYLNDPGLPTEVRQYLSRINRDILAGRYAHTGERLRLLTPKQEQEMHQRSKDSGKTIEAYKHAG